MQSDASQAQALWEESIMKKLRIAQNQKNNHLTLQFPLAQCIFFSIFQFIALPLRN